MTRRLFERLSGMWIKVGQLLSLRTDLMSASMCRALSSLQYQMRGFPAEIARRVVEEELGRPISAVFAHFDEEPFAAASIAQVHRATLLRNDRAVVVKVMRPDVARAFARDLRLLQFVVRVATSLGLLARFRLQDAMVELRSVLEEEVDYELEAVSLRRMRRNLRAHGIYVPRVVKDLSSRRMLVIEEVAGVLMSQYIRARDDDPDKVHRWAVLNGIDSDAVARRLIITVLRQVLEDNEFHGDLHPGNIMLLSDNRVALIDFGSVGRLQHRTWMLYQFAMSALADRDFERAADLMLMISPSGATANLRRLRRDMTHSLQSWEFNSQKASARYKDRSLAAVSNEMASVMARHNVPLTWGLMRVGRTFSTLDASLQTLVPDSDFMKLARAYFRDRKRRRSTVRGQAEAIGGALRQAGALAGDLQVLLSIGLRQQALQLYGMLDRAGRVRLTMLTFLLRGIWLIIGVTAIDFAIDTYLRDYAAALGLSHRMVKTLVDATPHMLPVHWVLLLIVGLFLSRLVRTTRRALVRPGD
jgi:ubiquinone biosynthesis protein